MTTPSDFTKSISETVSEILSTEFTKEDINSIPDNIPLEGNKWLYCKDVTCVYADMVGSTQLQIHQNPIVSAKVYQIFVKSLVLTFNNYEAEYVDIKGDGAFAIFTGKTAPLIGLCAAVTFKTICSNVLRNKIPEFQIKTHIGIDHKSVLVKRIGMRGDKQNEVWAGKPVNMAAKLSSLSAPDSVLVSDRVFNVYNSDEYRDYVAMSCGCGSEDKKPKELWTQVDVSDKPFFDFTKAYRLGSEWCSTHGDEYCKQVLALANE
jgi:class 3 adenylate cyclase